MTIERIVVNFNIPSFFKYYDVINAKAFSKRMGMNNTLFFQYVKGVKKPFEKQVTKILTGIKTIGKELSELDIAG